MSKADELRLLREAIKSFPEALAIWSAEGKLVACSDLYTRLAEARGSKEVRRSVRRLEGGARLELLTDVGDLHRAEQAARLLAYHDAATGLPNRRLLDDRLRQAIRLAQRRDRMVGVLVVRLEDFDQVSETALRELVQRLAGCVRKADTLARIGVDQFALALSDLKDDADCRLVADKVLQALGGEFRPSIGIALYPADGADAETLLRNADAGIVFSAR